MAPTGRAEMGAFWLCFVPLRIAVDVPGVLPLSSLLLASIAVMIVRKGLAAIAGGGRRRGSCAAHVPSCPAPA